MHTVVKKVSKNCNVSFQKNSLKEEVVGVTAFETTVYLKKDTMDQVIKAYKEHYGKVKKRTARA